MGGAARPNFEYDFVVVGGGYAGIFSAWRLTRAGARVLLLERGASWTRGDFQQSWDLSYLGRLYDFAISESVKETFRASRILGGGSTTNAMMHQRPPSEVFDFVDPQTGRRAWPRGINRQSLEPYFDEIERVMRIRQIGWDEVSKIGGNFARLFHDAGFPAEPGRFNMGRDCNRCGYCEAGCSFPNAKLTLVDTVLPEAQQTGRLALWVNVTASKVKAVPGGYTVDCIPTGQSMNSTQGLRTVAARRVILAAGPLGTVPLLQRSIDDLPRMEGVESLGEWVNNNGDVNFVAQTPSHYPNHEGYKTVNNNGIISYAFWDQYRMTMHGGMAPVPHAAGTDMRFPGGLSFGLNQKHFIHQNVIHRLIPFAVMRQMPSTLHLRLNEEKQAVVSTERNQYTEEHFRICLDAARRVAEGSGGRLLYSGMGQEPFDMGGNHILGGARMSDDPRYGVCDANGEVFGHNGLYVADSAVIPSSLGINPALAVAGVALQIADGIVRRT